MAQTPGNWLRSANMAVMSAECQKALLACGLNPGAFGTYSQSGKSQAKMRRALQDHARGKPPNKKDNSPHPHVAPCTLPPTENKRTDCRCHESLVAQQSSTPLAFLHANSQAGHVSQDALYRQQGGRGDPCQNHPPGAQDSGTYGYDTDTAPCMDHYGKSTLKGSTHWAVTQAERDFQAEMAAKGKGPLTMDDMRLGVRNSATIAVTSGRYRMSDDGVQPVSPTPEGEAVRDKLVADQAAAKVGNGQAPGAGPQMSKDMKGLTEDEAKAVKCIEEHWENALKAMQLDAAQNNSSSTPAGRKAAVDAYNKAGNTPPAKKWEDLDDKQKDKAIEARQRVLEEKMKNGNNPTSPPAAQESKESLKAKDKDNPNAGKDAPTEAECREYQANWLHLKSKGGGPIPPMLGQNPTEAVGGEANGEVESGRESN